MSGILYIVGTPIGNLKDITLHAIEVLKNVDLIACEDTRHTKILLDRYSIKTSTTSYHKFNIRAKTDFIIERVKEGKKVALVSDAGMPGISDPGEELIRAALKENIRVEVVPGPSAAVSALSISGLDSSRFTFEGFLPSRQAARRARLSELKGENRTMIFYEAPHRIADTLGDMRGVFGDREVSIVRELTKVHEEIVKGSLSEIADRFAGSRNRGEFVIVIEGSGLEEVPVKSPQLLIDDIVGAGVSKRDAVRIVSRRLGLSKNELYRSTIGD